MSEIDYPIYPNNRAYCSKCGKKEFFEDREASKIKNCLMCRCKGCEDVHGCTSRIGLDEWRKRLIKEIISDELR
jgi:hypothetical protein